MAGKGTNPKLDAIGEKGRDMPIPITIVVINRIGKDALL